MDPNDNGETIRVQIVETIHSYDNKHKDNYVYIKFRWYVNDDIYEEAGSYNEIIQHIEEDAEIIW